MRILVCGGRDFTNHIKFNRELIKVVYDWADFGLNGPWNNVTIIHGAARGADTLAGLFAKMFGLKVEAHPADWGGHGKAAGVLRNQRMLDAGIDLVVAFPGGTGTADMVFRSIKAGVRVIKVGA